METNVKVLADMIARPRVAVFSDEDWDRARTAMISITALRVAGAVHRVLIITKKGDMSMWTDLGGIAVKGGGDRRRETLAGGDGVYVLSVALVRWLANENQPLRFDAVVVDGCPGRKAESWTALAGICRGARRVIVIDDVPDSQELWGRVYMLDGGARLGGTIDDYRARWFYPDNGRDGYVWSWRPYRGAEQQIAAAVKDVCVRIRIPAKADAA